jgi:hypothetical protein
MEDQKGLPPRRTDGHMATGEEEREEEEAETETGEVDVEDQQAPGDRPVLKDQQERRGHQDLLEVEEEEQLRIPTSCQLLTEPQCPQ